MIDAAALADALGRPAPTDEQTAVIEAGLEPMLVVAGAGSGKTETMASRVVYLVANGLVTPDRVLGLTFTRKAAGELATRIRSRLHLLAGRGVIDRRLADAVRAADPAVGTYHAFAGNLIGEFGPMIGVEPPSRVLTETASWHLARQVVGHWDGALDTDLSTERVTEDVLALAGALSDHLVDDDALLAELDRLIDTLESAPAGPRQKAEVHSGLAGPLRQLRDRRSIVPLVAAYHRAKREARAVDFADQMRLAARLVTEVPRVGRMMRERHAVVLLDEYQDTGHAQRVILAGLFGAGSPDGRGHPVVAVGDPVQSIYGWRGASASNLPRFSTDFPTTDGRPAERRSLLTSFRNSSGVLDLANTVSAPLREHPVPVGELRPRPGAGAGSVESAVCGTVTEENDWVAERLATIWAESDDPPTTAVLVRRRSGMAALADAIRARGLPVEVIGIGGLIDIPEIADTIALLRMVVDHQSGPGAVRILTGARWRLGAADLAALARRGRELDASGVPGAHADRASSSGQERLRSALDEALTGEEVDSAGLVDALADPGPADHYSREGLRRIDRLATELRWLRSRLTAPLTDLVSDIARVSGLDVEALLTFDGRAHLDAFAGVVADLAAGGAGPVELLDYLATAAEHEDGLSPGAVQPRAGCVQILTVHGAKGLEWDVVAVPQLAEGIFPSTRNTTWLGSAGQLPPALRGDRDGLPGLELPAGADQGQLVKAIKQHTRELGTVRASEERRLLYVAVTRARHTLLLSAHHWGATGRKPRGPGALLAELKGHPMLDGTDGWTPAPDPDDGNPLLQTPPAGTWPVDPLGDRRAAVEAGAALVRHARAQSVGSSTVTGGPADTAATTDAGADRPDDRALVDGDADDPDGWKRDVRLLLAERAARRETQTVSEVQLPSALTVSSLVQLADDPETLAARLARPVPEPPAPQARRGTAFHLWLEHHFGGDPLLDIDDLPGAHDESAADDEHLPDLIDAFRRSEWADRVPIAIEAPFATHIAGIPVRGRIDAVFADGDGGVTVVDWKTGRPPSGDRAQVAAVQLATYRLAWSRLSGLPLDRVRAAFYYVAADRTVNPADLADERGLHHIIESALVG